MSGKIQISNKEKKVLTILLLLLAAALAVFLLLGRFLQPRVKAPLSNKDVKIALLLPLKGDLAWIGAGQKVIANEVLDSYAAKLQEAGWSVQLTFVNAGKRPNSTARAAEKIGRNLSNVALIAPYDSRQTLATAQMGSPTHLPVLALASSNGILGEADYDNLFRMVSQENQEAVLVDVLEHNGLTSVMMVVQPTSFGQSQVDAFNRVAEGRVVVVSNLVLDDQSQTQFSTKIAESKPNAILFFGQPDGLARMISYMTAAGVQLPIFATDSINNPEVLNIPRPGIDIYYTSPYYNAGQLENASRPAQVVAKRYPSIPFAYETALSVEMVCEALLDSKPSSRNRQAVFDYLGGRYFSGGNVRQGAKIYLYHLSPDQTDWNLNPIVND